MAFWVFYPGDKYVILSRIRCLIVTCKSNLIRSDPVPNFFTYNADLVRHFERLDLEQIVSWKEHDFEYSRQRDDAPPDYESAMNLYRTALELLGQICADDIAGLRQDIDSAGTTLSKGKVSYAPGTYKALTLLSESGFMGTMLPREYGGLHFPATIYMFMIEIVSRADPSLMTCFGYQDVGELIARFGSQELAQRFLPGLASGKHIGAIVLSEPGAGSDLQAIKVRAEQDEEGNWSLNGIKHFISNGCGDVLMVLARSEPGDSNIFGLSLFACPASDAVIVNRVEEKMGLHGSPTCELEFRNAPAYLIGSRRVGFTKYILESLNQARFSVAAQAIGIAEAAFQEALAYSKIRKQFGKYICEIPAVANLLLDIETDIQSSRTLLYEGAYWLDLKVSLGEHIARIKAQNGDPAEFRKQLNQASRKLNLLSPMVKYLATEAANRACYNAQQVFGGMGYMRETGVEQLVRDVRVTTIYEGTSQVQVSASLKSVMADILASDFDARHERLAALESPLLERIGNIRQSFMCSRAFLESRNDPAYTDASARNIVDIYGSILTSYLLLDRIDEDQQNMVAKRYIISAEAAAQAKSLEIMEDFFTAE